MDQQVHQERATAKQAEAPAQEPIEELASLIESEFRFPGGELRELAATLYRTVA